MDVIKKKMQAMKLEKDNAMDKADTCEGQAKEANLRADKVLEEVGDLTKKLAQVEADLEANKQALEQANRDLEDREKSLTNVSIISTCFTYLYSSYHISLLHCNKINKFNISYTSRFAKRTIKKAEEGCFQADDHYELRFGRWK